MWRNWVHAPVRPVPDRWAMIVVLTVVIAAYTGVVLGVTLLGATPHGRSLQAAPPIAILPR
jgi:hypothetical protein